MNIHRNKITQIFLALFLISFSLTGSDCDKVLQNNGGTGVPQELVGSWTLSEQTGALQDICPAENVSYQSTGVAQLTCPGSVSISRNFNVENDVLTYTQTSIEYDIEFFENQNGQNLALYGRNVSRNLLYIKIPATDVNPAAKEKNKLNNSSEAKE